MGKGRPSTAVNASGTQSSLHCPSPACPLLTSFTQALGFGPYLPWRLSPSPLLDCPPPHPTHISTLPLTHPYMQALDFGRYLRWRYSMVEGLLPDQWEEGVVNARTTNYQRTVATLQVGWGRMTWYGVGGPGERSQSEG